MTSVVDPNNYSNTANPTTSIAGADGDPSDPAPQSAVLNGWLDFIRSLTDNYMNPYTEAVRKYTAFLTDVTNLEAYISQRIQSSGDDKQPVAINCAEIKAKIEDLIAKYSLPQDAGSLFTSTATGTDGQNQALEWAAEFGLDSSAVTRTSDGKWTVRMDLNPFMQIANVFNRSGTNFDIPTYNQIITAKDAQVQTIKNTMQVLTEKYSRAFATSNNITTLFSSICKSTFDMMASYLK